MKYKTKNNHVVKAVYRAALRGNFRNAALCLYQHRAELTEDVFYQTFNFIVEKTRLIDYVKSFDPYTRSGYFQMLDDYIKIYERRFIL